MKPLNKLSPQHRVAVALKLSGHSHKQIAEAVGASKSAVDQWARDPLFKEEIEAQTEKMLSTLHDKITAGAAAALDVAIARVQAPAAERPILDDDGKVIEYEPVSIYDAPITDYARENLIEKLTDMHPVTRVLPVAQIDTDTNGDSGSGGLLGRIRSLPQEEQDKLVRLALEHELKTIEATGRKK